MEDLNSLLVAFTGTIETSCTPTSCNSSRCDGLMVYHPHTLRADSLHQGHVHEPRGQKRHGRYAVLRRRREQCRYGKLPKAPGAANEHGSTAYADTTKPKKQRRISSFQALMVSTASRVGTGNIVGIATAIAIGGPGRRFLDVAHGHHRRGIGVRRVDACPDLEGAQS